MKKVAKPIVAVAAIAAVVAVFFYARSRSGPERELYNGILEAAHVDVRSEATGRVIAVPAAEGSLLEAGSVICELDRTKLELQHRGARSELAAQRAVLEAMQEGARSQEIEQARLVLEQARTQRRRAEEDYGRIARLFSKKAVSQFELDQARTARDLSRDQEARAKKAYELVLAGVRDEELKAQLAVVDAAEARAEYYRLMLDDTVIKSPVKGRLVERYLEPGELVMPGGLVASVADYTRLEVKVYVPEDRVGAIALEQPARVLVDSFPDQHLSGRVSHKSREAEFTPKNVQTREERTTLVYEVTVSVENPGEWAVAGLPADVMFMPGKNRKAADADK